MLVSGLRSALLAPQILEYQSSLRNLVICEKKKRRMKSKESLICCLKFSRQPLNDLSAKMLNLQKLATKNSFYVLLSRNAKKILNSKMQFKLYKIMSSGALFWPTKANSSKNRTRKFKLITIAFTQLSNQHSKAKRQGRGLWALLSWEITIRRLIAT